MYPQGYMYPRLGTSALVESGPERRCEFLMPQFSMKIKLAFHITLQSFQITNLLKSQLFRLTFHMSSTFG